MPKRFEICKLCGAKRFVNALGLCKRCSSDPKAIDIKEDALAHRKEMRALRREAREADAAAAEAAAAEAPEGEAAEAGSEEASSEEKSSEEGSSEEKKD